MSTRPLRVLRVIARMNVGGPALQVAALTEGLDPERFEQRLLVGVVDPLEADYLELRAPDTPATVIRGLGRAPHPTDDLRALRAIHKEVRRFRPHIVHTHTAKAGFLGRLAAVVGRTPARVHHFHGHLLHSYFSPRATKAVVGVERTLARVTDRFLAVGGQVRDDLVAAGIGTSDRYVVVPPGIKLPDPPTRHEARRALHLPLDAPVAAYVARLTAIKRPDRFIEVAELVTEQLPDAIFLVAGEGDQLDELRQRAASLGDRVRFLGWRPDVETIYAAADVTVLTSDNEGMPVSLIEAATIGCPAVTADVGSAGEVVIDGVGGLVRPRDPQLLADATVQMLSDPSLRSRLATGAREHAQMHFSQERLLNDVTSIYEELAREKRLA